MRYCILISVEIQKILKSYCYPLLILTVVFFSFLLYFSSVGFAEYRFFVVQSGSMHPELQVGDLILTQKANTYFENDIITVKRKYDVPLTHRITDKPDQAQNIFVTRGDQNGSNDPDLVLQSDIIGKVIFRVPLLGNMLEYLKTDAGMGVFIVTPITYIIYTELHSIKKEITTSREKRLI